MISPVFDGDEIEPQHRYLILSPPRSGSYWLCRQLWTAGLGLPFEYLNRLHLRRLSKRWGTPLEAFQPRTRSQRLAARLGLGRQRQDATPTGAMGADLQAYLSQAERRRSRHGWFGLKVQPLHLRELNLQPAVAFTDWMLLPLMRRDQRRQLASYLFSRVSGAYDMGLITTNEGEGLDYLENPGFQEKTAVILAEQNRLILELCRQRDITPLWMEDLMSQSSHELQRTLIRVLPPLSSLGQCFQPIAQRGGPLHDAKQQLLGDFARRLPDHLVSKLTDSLQP